MMTSRYHIISRSDIGKIRQRNEDAVGVSTANQLPSLLENDIDAIVVLADGMGGHPGGDIASQLAVNVCLTSLCNLFGVAENKNQTQNQDKTVPLQQTSLDRADADEIEKAMLKAIRAANRAIFSTALRQPHLENMGTTIVVCVLQHHDVYIAHIGDSRVYLADFDQNQQQSSVATVDKTDTIDKNALKLITKDHSLKQSLLDSGALSEAASESFAHAHTLTQALGSSLKIKPSFNRLQLAIDAKPILLLCSDGLSNSLSHGQLASLLHQATTLDAKADQLIAAANEAGGLDNISLILITPSDTEPGESV